MNNENVVEENVVEENESMVAKQPSQYEVLANRIGHKKAKKHLHVNRHEIKRLETLAEKALIENLPESYKYCISRLREISLQQQLPSDVMQMMWLTSKERIDELIVQAYHEVMAK